MSVNDPGTATPLAIDQFDTLLDACKIALSNLEDEEKSAKTHTNEQVRKFLEEAILKAEQ